MAPEPLAGESHNLFQSAGLLKQMPRMRNDLHFCLRAHFLHRPSIHIEHGMVVSTDDKESGRFHPGKNAGQRECARMGILVFQGPLEPCVGE